MMRRLTMPSRISEPGAGGIKEARESLTTLTDLLEKGEKKGIFSSRMPPSIERAIREDNVRFMQNRDVYCEDYNKFMFDLATVNTYKHRVGQTQYSELCVESVKLGVQFLFNTYYHVKQRRRGCLSEWLDGLHSLITLNMAACDWLVDFLASDQGIRYIKPYLVESSARDVRHNFSQLVEKIISSHNSHHHGHNQNINTIIQHLVSLLSKTVNDNIKHCSRYFWLLFEISQMVNIFIN